MCAADSGDTLSTPVSSVFDFEPGESAGLDEAERFGRTAEADIPEFLDIAGGLLWKDMSSPNR